MNIDMHSHFFPLDAFRKAEKYRASAPKVTLEKERYTVASRAGTRGNLGEGAQNAQARMKELDRMSIDIQALSPSPILLFYEEQPAAASYFSRLQNEAIAEVVRAHPDRFVGFGTVPLQDVSEAIAVAREAKELGLRGLEIGTSVEGKPLDDPEFEPFYDAVEQLDLLLFVHPTEGGGLERNDAIMGFLGNVVVFPYRTTLMIERMILGGLLEKYRNLRFCLAHGGGFLAYNVGRLDHAYAQRGDFRDRIARKPSEYLKRIYFDSIVHSVLALQYLVQAVGADRIVMGTDYPMAMGEAEPVQKIMALGSVSDEERAQMLGTNAMRILGLSTDASSLR